MEKGYKGSGDGLASGVHSTQPECRESLPPSEAVKEAVAEPKGTTTAIARKQTKDGVN